MRLKLQDMINGKFEYSDVRLFLPEEKLSITVLEHQSLEGSFVIESSTDKPIRGIVSCPNPHMECLTPEFKGVKASIRYRYANDSSVEGDVDHGYFVFATDAGEYTYDFKVKITRKYARTSIGTIKTINDFSNLCKLNWDEALSLFQSRYFDSIFHKNANYFHLLYQGITYRESGSREMEEFLIAAGKKKQNDFSLDVYERSYEVSNTPVHDVIVVTKKEWGYMDIDISCDASFIQMKKHHLNMYDFAGKHASIPILILPDQLHSGNNYARITFTYGFKSETMVIVVKKPRQNKDPYRHYRKLCYMQLELQYLSYLRGEYTSDELCHEAMPLLHKLQEWEPDKYELYFYEAYLCLLNDTPENASQVLKAVPSSLRYQKSQQYLFYQFVERESLFDPLPKDYVNKIRDSLKKNPGDPHLQWLLMHTDESLTRNPQRIYHYVREYVSAYSTSPIFLQIGANLLLNNPELFDGNHSFDMRLITWMGQHKLLSEKLALRMQAYAQTSREYNDGFFRVLTRCSRMFPHIDMVKTICVYLIKSSRYGEAYFSWFQKGVEQKLKIAGLYEGYMLSWSRSNGELPAVIIKYFSMNSSLPARKKAQLFSYVVRNKARLGNDWPIYMEMVIDFAKQQLASGYMSDDMAIIYEEVKHQLSEEQWNEIKGNSEYCYKIHTQGIKAAFVRILWHYPDIRQQRVPIIAEKAFVYLFHKPLVILYEDSNGRVFAAGRTYRLNKMLSGNHIYEEPDNREMNAERISQDADELQALRLRLESFEDTSERMMDMIHMAEDCGIPTQEYKHRLIIRMLFTENLCQDHLELFEELVDNPEAETLVRAYTALLSRQVLMEADVLPEVVYRYLERQIAEKKQLNNYCELAFLNTYAERWDATCADSAEYILKKYLLKNVYMEAYVKLPYALRRKYMLMGVEVIAYVCNTNDDLYVRFDEHQREQMTQVITGLYTYPVSFLDTSTKDYVILDQEGNILYRGVICGSEIEERFADTRFGRIAALQDHAEDHDMIYEYAGMSDVVDTLFVPIKE